MKVDEAKYSIAEILNWMRSKELVANSNYQRGGGLWPNAARSYFIDTILRGFPFPKVYFYESVDKETKKPKREIVDGQQRLTTILDFVDGKFALGANAREFNGRKFVELPAALSVDHVSGAARKAKNSGPAAMYWGSTNSILRNEPTWGDVDVLNLIIPRLGPANQVQLLAAVSQASDGAKLLQKIRNATAHRNPQTMAEIVGLSSGFIVFPITDPTHALFWSEPVSSSFVINYAISELKVSATLFAA